MKKYAVKNNKLLDMAQSIFGKDLVVDAWLISSANSNNHKELFSQLKYENNMLTTLLKEKKNEIDIGCITVAIKFSSGNIVSFSSSEWGDIRTPDYEMIML